MMHCHIEVNRGRRLQLKPRSGRGDVLRTVGTTVWSSSDSQVASVKDDWEGVTLSAHSPGKAVVSVQVRVEPWSEPRRLELLEVTVVPPPVFGNLRMELPPSSDDVVIGCDFGPEFDLW